MSFDVEWRDAGLEAKVAPNPDYPLGKDLDLAGPSVAACKEPLPYPARRRGLYIVECNICGRRIGVTTAGRPDDPRSIRIPCNLKGSA